MVWNKSGSTINDLRVEIEEIVVNGVRIVKIPLQEMRDTAPYKRDFVLHDDETIFFRVLKKLPDENRITLCSASPDAPSPLNLQEYEFVITARGSNVPPSKLRMKISPGDAIQGVAVSLL